MMYGVLIILTVMVYLYLINEQLCQSKQCLIYIIIGYIALGFVMIKVSIDEYNVVIYLMVTTLLYISVVSDIYNRTLSIEYYLSAIPVVLIKLVLFSEGLFDKDLLYNLAMVIVLIVLGYVFRASLGFGDILLFITLTMLVGYDITLLLIFIALVLTAVFGLAMIIMSKANRRSRLPFTPFILLGYIIYVFV